MKDLLRKAYLFGLGMFDFTREKVDELVQEMVQRGEISDQESPEMVKQILQKAKETQQALFDKVSEVTKNVVNQMNFAKASDLEALERRVAALEAELRSRQGA